MITNILSYGIGTLIAFVCVAGFAFLFIRDITQKKHSVLRNYPVVGRLRYKFEELGEYFRQYFFMGDRDEMPFNRATRRATSAPSGCSSSRRWCGHSRSSSRRARNPARAACCPARR